MGTRCHFPRIQLRGMRGMRGDEGFHGNKKNDYRLTERLTDQQIWGTIESLARDQKFEKYI